MDFAAKACVAARIVSFHKRCIPFQPYLSLRKDGQRGAAKCAVVQGIS